MPEDPLHIRLEPIDQRHGHFTLTFDSSQYPVIVNSATSVAFSEWLRRLPSVLSGGSDPSGQLVPQQLLREVGIWLWQALLPESAPKEACEALAHALRTEFTPLLLTLPDTLAGLPWELLCDPEKPGERGFLARRRPLMRFYPSATPVTPVAPPLRLLLLISSPPGLKEVSRVDVESERAAVEQATRNPREAGLLHLLVEDIVTPRRVQQALVRFQPHIVHYIGHGGYNDEAGGMLLWEDEQGKALSISAARLADLLRPRHLSAVVLHACETGRSDARTDVLGVADTLLKEGLPIVLAQQANFSYVSSQRASEAWYTSIMSGQGFAEALFEVRQALSLENQPDWAVPVLYGGATGITPVLKVTALPGPADPLLTSQGAAADLPTPTGVFVGRHPELRALHLMLENAPGSGPALALITGPGGIGKSTLVAQAVTRYGGKYKAVLTLSCLGYQSVELFLQRIGEFLKRQGASSFLEQTLPDPKLSIEAKIEEALAALNQAGPFLLVVDNLESAQNEDHIVRDESLLYLLQKLLTNLRVGRALITGRYEVKGLQPAGKFATNLLHLNLEDLSPYETNQLLLQHPTLAMLGEVVRQILVREFGGLPYVYDLLSSKAASQNLDLLIHDVQGRITQERKRHTADEWRKVHRQIVEFTALEESIGRLPESSRTLLAKLSVLHRPFPLAAIEQGLGAVPAIWEPLLDWSLLRYDHLEQNYHLHNVTRRYAEDLLDEQDYRQVQIQLATWYIQYAEQESRNLADVLEAHRLLRAAGSAQQAGELVVALASPFKRDGLFPFLRELCLTTLHDIGDSDERLTAKIRHELGGIAELQGNYEEARQLYKQSLVISERLGDQSERARSLGQLGSVTLRQRNYEEAKQFFQQSLEIYEQLGDEHGQAFIFHNLGMIAQDQGDFEAARRFYQQSLAITEPLGDQSLRANTLGRLEFRDPSLIAAYRNQDMRASTLGQLGIIAQDQGDYEAARQFHQQSLAIREQTWDQGGQAITLHSLGIIARRQRNYQEARRLFQQSLSIHEQRGDRKGQAVLLHQLGMVAQDQGDYEEARRFYQQSQEIHRQLGDQSGQAGILHQLGMIAQRQENYQEALRLFQQSLSLHDQFGDLRGRASTLYHMGSIAQDQGNYEEAQRLYQQDLAIAERLGDQNLRAVTLRQLGSIAQDQGNYEEAQRFYQQSQIIYERLGDHHGQVGVLKQLGSIAQDRGDYEEAQRFYQQGLAIEEQLGDQSSQASILHQLGNIAREQRNYEEARRLYQQSLTFEEKLGDQSNQASTLDMLGVIAHDQGDYEEAKRLVRQSLAIQEQLGDQRRQAASLHLLGTIAREQENYEEALRLHQQSLAISEQLGDQNGRAGSFAMLGLLAYVQDELEQALTYSIQALVLFDDLHSSSPGAVQSLISKIRSRMDEATFTRLWNTNAGGRPLPALPGHGILQRLMQAVITFIQAPTWTESKQFLEAHLELLQPEVEAILRALEIQQEDSEIRETIREHRKLLANCRESGIEAAFKELQEAKRTYQQSLEIKELDDQRWQAGILYQLGMLAQEQGKHEEARGLYSQSLTIFERLNDRDGKSRTLHKLGELAQEQGQYDEAAQKFGEAMKLFEQLGNLEGYASSQYQLGALAKEQGDNEKAQRLYQDSLVIWERLDNEPGQASCLYGLGYVALSQGGYTEAYRFFQKSLAIWKRLDDLRGQAHSLDALGAIAKHQRNYVEAGQFYQKSYELWEGLGDLRGQAASLFALGNIAQLQKDYPRARQFYQKSLTLWTRLDDLREQATLLYHLGMATLWQENFLEARQYYQKSLELQKQLGDLQGQITSLHWLGMTAMLQEDLVKAAQFYQDCLALQQRLGDQQGQATSLYRLGMIAEQQENFAEAHQFYKQTLTLQERLGDLQELAKSLSALGNIARLQGDLSEARQLYQKNLALLEQLGDQQEQLITLEKLAEITEQQEDYEGAHQYYQKCLIIQKKLGDQRGQATSLHQLGIIAQSQGKYKEAQQLYQESLNIEEQLDNKSGQAASLYQLGTLAYVQDDFVSALVLMVKLLTITGDLPFSDYMIALHLITKIRTQMDEGMFAELWQETAYGLPLSVLFPADTDERLLNSLADFIETRTWAEAQRFIESHPDLLLPKVDELFESLELLLQHHSARNQISQYRKLLARCREVGVARAFAEQQTGQEERSGERRLLAQLNALCRQVVEAQRTGDQEQREALAKQLDQMIKNEMPLEGAHDFLALLAAWLRDEDVTGRVEILRPDFQDTYYRMVEVVTDGEPGENNGELQASLASQTVSMLDRFARSGWAERYQLLTAHADMLLAESIEGVFAELLQVNKESEVRQFLEELRTLLRRCRTWGIDPAWYLELHMHLGQYIAIPTEYEPTVMQIASLLSQQEENGTALEQAIEVMQALLNRLAADATGHFKAALLWELADTIKQLPANHPLRILDQMEAYYRDALRLYQSLDRSIDVVSLQHSLGNILYEQGRYQEALELFQEAIVGLQASGQYNQASVWVLSDYAGALDSLGQTEKALTIYNEAITLLPESAVHYRNRAAALIHLRRLAEAEADLAQAVTLDGHENSPYLWYRRAQVAIARGDGLLADQLLDEVVKRDASFDVALQRAQAAWLQGNLQTTQELFQQVWEKANEGERAETHREMKHLLEEHPELAGRDALQAIMMSFEQ